MITIQVIMRPGIDAYKILRDKVTREAQTWSWKNKSKTVLVHVKAKTGYIKVSGSDNVLTARIHPYQDRPEFLAEKFVGRLVAWFPNELFAITIQVISESGNQKK